MQIGFEVESNINIPKHMQKIQSDPFWTFAATQWHRLYQPWVPYESGNLADLEVRIRPNEIEHYAPYAKKLYEGHFKYHNKHP